MCDAFFYILDGLIPVPMPAEDHAAWSAWCLGHNLRMASTRLTLGVYVWTCFLGYNGRGIHTPAGEGPPLLFQTRCDAPDTAFDGAKAYASTWVEAEQQHAALVAHVLAQLAQEEPPQA